MSVKPRHASNPLDHTLKAIKPVLIYSALFSCFINLLLLLVPLYSMQVLDRVLSTGSTETLTWLTVIMLAAFAAASLLQTVRSFVLVRLGEWMDRKMSPLLLAHGLSGMASIRGNQGTQPLRDMQSLRQFITGNGMLTLFDAPWSAVYLLILFIIDSSIGGIVLLGCLILLGLAWLNERAMRPPLDEANESNIANFQHMEMAQRNTDVIEAMGMKDAVIGRWQGRQDRVTRLQSQASGRSAIIQAFSRFFRLMLQIAVIGWGAYLALHNHISSGSIIAASILAGKAFAPFDAAISLWKSVIEAREAKARLQVYLSSMQDARQTVSLPPPRGALEVEKVVFALPGMERPILKGVSFALEAGDILGIIGPSAAGKSTLARLIVGSWEPYSGMVRLDKADMKQWKREELGPYVGYLPQDAELFSGTVRDNIARLRDNATDEEVIKAAKLAGAHQMILALPNGYGTDVGMRGAALSAGQRQRIGLARAFFGHPKLVVLDEPDANLDEDGEAALAQALQFARAQGITTIVVTHRKHVLAYVNKLLLMRDGQAEMFGPAREVAEALALRQKKQSELAQMRKVQAV